MAVFNISTETPPAAFEQTAFHYVLNVIVAGTLSVVGIFCNVLAIIVLQMDRHKLSMCVLLQGLAVTDILFLVYTFLYTTLRSVYPYTGEAQWAHEEASPYIVAYVLPCGWIAQTAGIWLVVAVTVDRYLYVCHPFSANRWCSISRARSTVAGVWLASVVFNSPRFFYYYSVSFQEESMDTRNSTVADSNPMASSGGSTFVAHQDAGLRWENYRTVYHIGLTWVFLYVIPLPVLLYLNARLIKVISDAKKRHVQFVGSHREKRDIGVTLNMVVIVTVFIVCETPDFVAAIIKLDQFSGSMDEERMDYFLCIKEALLVLNAASNFFIYCLFYTKFRRLLRFVVCCCCVISGDMYSSETWRPDTPVKKGSPGQLMLGEPMVRDTDLPLTN